MCCMNFNVAWRVFLCALWANPLKLPHQHQDHVINLTWSWEETKELWNTFVYELFTSMSSRFCQKRVREWEELHTSLCRGITGGNEAWTRSSTSFCHKVRGGGAGGELTPAQRHRGPSSGDHAKVLQITVVGWLKEKSKASCRWFAFDSKSQMDAIYLIVFMLAE